MRLLLHSIALSSLLATVASSAYAGDPFAKPASSEAREHLARGNKFYGVREFETAIAEYKAGALVEPTPIFDYNLGQCYRHLGNYDAATWHYERFLRRAQPDGEVLEAVEDFIAQMAVERQNKAMSQPLPQAVPASALSMTRSSSTPGTTIPAITLIRSSASVAEPWYSDGFGWGLAGTGLAGAAVAGGLFLSAGTLRNEANRTAAQQERDTLHDKADTRRLLGTVVGIGGVGLLATGFVKLALHESDAGAATAWKIGVSPSGMTLLGSF